MKSFSSIISLLASSLLFDASSGSSTNLRGPSDDQERYLSPLSSNEANAYSGQIVDLSKPFDRNVVNNSSGAEALNTIAKERSIFSRMMVVEDGKIVYEYNASPEIPRTEPLNIWSCTKPLMTMIMGKIMSDNKYNLTSSDTLGSIFPNQEDWQHCVLRAPDWTGGTCLAWSPIYGPAWNPKRKITVHEIMSMTSGLRVPMTLTEHILNLDVPNHVGEDQQRSLWQPNSGFPPGSRKGTYDYVPAGNIHSYIVQRVTGKNPREFLNEEFLPHLGISNDEIKWDTNSDGMPTSLSHMHLTADQHAKFLQLFLQKGLAAPGKQILSNDFIQTATSQIVPRESGADAIGQLEQEYSNLGNPNTASGSTPDWHGYSWVTPNDATVCEIFGDCDRNLKHTGEYYAFHPGIGGQVGMFSPRTKRVIVIHTKCELIGCVASYDINQSQQQAMKELQKIALSPMTSFK